MAAVVGLAVDGAVVFVVVVVAALPLAVVAVGSARSWWISRRIAAARVGSQFRPVSVFVGGLGAVAGLLGAAPSVASARGRAPAAAGGGIRARTATCRSSRWSSAVEKAEEYVKK